MGLGNVIHKWAVTDVTLTACICGPYVSIALDWELVMVKLPFGFMAHFTTQTNQRQRTKLQTSTQVQVQA